MTLVARDLAVARCRGSGPARDRVLGDVARRLGLLHGLPQKLGQLMAFSELESSDPAFAPLTENAPTLAAGAAFAAIESALGAPIASRFRELAPEGISASIGQVHRGVLQDGRPVAVKVQYPGIAECIEWDLKALGWITAPVGDLSRGFDLAAYRREIGRSLREELDYAREAAALQQFRAWTRGWPTVVTPELIPACSRGSVLTMTWLDGLPLSRARNAPRADRVAFASTLVRLLLHGLFRWRGIHADPHPGNFRFLSGPDGPRVGVLDFGCMQEIGPDWASGLASLLDAVEQRSDTKAEVLAGFRSMGFDTDRLSPLAGKLVELLRVLAEPFLTEGEWQPATWRLGERLGTLLGEHRMTFRTAGPPSLIFILRAFQGLLQYLKAFDVPVRWRDAWKEVRPRVPSKPGLRAGPAAAPGAARRLHVRILEHGLPRVELTLPSSALGSVAELMPTDVVARLDRRGLSVSEIGARALRAGCPAGEVFLDRHDAREIRVWLE